MIHLRDKYCNQIPVLPIIIIIHQELAKAKGQKNNRYNRANWPSCHNRISLNLKEESQQVVLHQRIKFHLIKTTSNWIIASYLQTLALLEIQIVKLLKQMETKAWYHKQTTANSFLIQVSFHVLDLNNKTQQGTMDHRSMLRLNSPIMSKHHLHRKNQILQNHHILESKHIMVLQTDHFHLILAKSNSWDINSNWTEEDFHQAITH